jgi:hypothetical protein
MGWESPEMAREVHAPTSEDVSPSVNTTNGSRPPTAEAGEGGKPVQSLYATARAYHAPVRGRPVELLLMSMESEGGGEADGEARAL